MADIIRVTGVKEVRVRVSPTVAGKVAAVDTELAQLGVEVRRLNFKAKGDVLAVVKTLWLGYNILKEAVGRWPAIKKVLVKAGLSPYEITTLNLSQYTRKKPVKKKK
jgi:hypothetical protein